MIVWVIPVFPDAYLDLTWSELMASSVLIWQRKSDVISM